MNQADRKTRSYRFLGLIGIVALVAWIGFNFFLFYTRSIMPQAAAHALALVSIAAGLASLFSPCSFPLLATFLARESSDHSAVALVRATVAFTAGVVLFLISMGAAIGLGAGVLITQFTFASTAGRWLRGLVGGLLMGLGFWQVRGRSLSWAWLNDSLKPLWNFQSKMRRRHSTLAYGLYGFGYILAGFG